MLRIGCVIILLVSLAGCGSSGKVAAVVNGQVITVEEVERRVSNLNAAARASFGNDSNRVLEQMVTETLLLQEARRRGLDRDSEVARMMREAHRQILFGRLLEMLGQEGQPAVTEDQIQQFYEQNPERFTQPEEFRASHILVSDAETAQKALARVKAGESLADVAQELSTDPSRTRGGDIGFFSAGQVIPGFTEACQALKPGEISDVVKTPLGYHIILLTERRAAGQRPLDEVRENIRDFLGNQQRQQHVGSVIQELRAKAQINIRERALPQPRAPATQSTASQSPAS